MKEYNVKELKYFGNCFITEEQNIIIEDESFKEEESNSNYMKKLDIAIICLNTASSVVMISLGCILSSRDSNADDWINKKFFLDWKSISECIVNYDTKKHNIRLTEENNKLKDSLKNLKD